MKKALVRSVSVAGGAAALLAVFGTGSAAAINEYKGQTYADAVAAIQQAGQTAVISSKIGSFLPTEKCIVEGSHTGSFLDSSGNNNSKVMLDLNCNYMFALPGVPGNSLASPEGRAARAAAEQQAAEQQAQAQAEQQAAEQAAAEQAAAEGAAGGG